MRAPVHSRDHIENKCVLRLADKECPIRVCWPARKAHIHPPLALPRVAPEEVVVEHGGKVARCWGAACERLVARAHVGYVCERVEV